MRGGAGISAIVVLIAFVFQWGWAIVAVAVALGIGALFGLRASPLGAAFRAIKQALPLQIAVEPEEEAPPRFAQLLGFVFLTLASVAFFVAGAGSPLGWTLALLVAGLQGLLAVTGLCIGCEIYRYTRRFTAKEA